MKKAQVLGMVCVLALVVAGCGAAQVGSFTPGPMPQEGNFDGVYQSDFGRLELTANGEFVFGLYEGEQKFGRIEGTVEGNLLQFHWTQWDERLGGKFRETGGRGVFQYIVDEEVAGEKVKYVHRFEGEWGFGEAMTGNRWNGYKLSSRSKKRLKRRSPTQSAPDAVQENDASGSGFTDVD